MIVVRHLREVRTSVAKRFRLRGLEWEHAFIALGFGLVLVFNPSVFFNGTSFRAFGGGPMLWGCIIAGVGLINIGALIVNGTVPRPTAALRTISAALQIMLFLLVSSGLLLSGNFTTGVWTYFVIGVFGFPAAAWALFDAVAPEYDE